MASNDYHFVTHWRVLGTREEVFDILSDAESLVRWWPSVYLGVERLKENGPDGTGGVVSLYTKGWLPYTLRWQFESTAADYPTTLTLAAQGDFEGRGIWTFTQDGLWVNIQYDWHIRAEKPLLRYFSWLIKPGFSANHRWAMRKGEESLKLELARRHAPTPADRERVPAPPGPTRAPGPALWLGLGGALAGFWLLFVRRSSASARRGK